MRASMMVQPEYDLDDNKDNDDHFHEFGAERDGLVRHDLVYPLNDLQFVLDGAFPLA
jgi:hypothetical protein